MARTAADLPAGSRITDYISLGVIAKYFPAEKGMRRQITLADAGAIGGSHDRKHRLLSTSRISPTAFIRRRQDTTRLHSASVTAIPCQILSKRPRGLQQAGA